MKDQRGALQEVLETGVQLAKEKDRTHLLEMIIDKGMKIAHCDAGTLYTYEQGVLNFKIMKTISMGVNKGGHGEVIDLPPVPLKEENICAFAAIHRKTVNIENVRASSEFDFSGPRRYDEITGYITKSMLVLPIVNQEDELIGVLQLINALNAEQEIIPFAPDLELIILSLASQAAIVMSNILYLEEMRRQMWSFTEAMAEAIDARTPYNGNHTRKVAAYAGQICDYINALYSKGKETEFFDDNRKDQLIMGALLHDIGKMIIPLEIMNKASRLGEKITLVKDRFQILKSYYEIDWLRGAITEEESEKKQKQLSDIELLVDKVNCAGYLDVEMREALGNCLDLTYECEGQSIPYFTEEEKKCLMVCKGTLTEEERGIMESHVEMTQRVLSKVHFNKYFENSAKWAETHHEMLDGSGYPKHLKGDQLELESRILAVADICDALLASDRPYKKPMPKEKAFAIMESMAKEGKLDAKLVEYAKACI